MLDSPDTSSPSQDLIALYTRKLGTDLEIRLDLLDVPATPDSDIYLALDTGPGGDSRLPLVISSDIDWDLLISIPAQGQPAAMTASTGFRRTEKILPRAIRIPWQDSIVVRLNRSTLPEIQAGFNLQAFLTDPSEPMPLDSLGPVRSDALPPGRAPVLLAFWNTFPAYTPALALRRWDGAHTGPFGGRHGLQILLSAVDRTGIPVALLDLKRPEFLSALDYVGGIPQIQALMDRNLLILPDALPGYPGSQNDGDPPVQGLTLPVGAWDRAAEESRSAGVVFGLPGSSFLYVPQADEVLNHSESGQVNEAISPGAESLPSMYRLVFSPLRSSQPLRWRDRVLIPLPSSTPGEQATYDGLSLQVRQTLLANAIQSGPPILILGGDLPESEWGSPEIAENALSYIAFHPWMQPLGPDDLLALHPSGGFDPGDLTGSNRSSGFSVRVRRELSPLLALQASNPMSRLAWDAYESLFAPVPPYTPDLPGLRAVYADQFGKLLEAARWSEAPRSVASCSSDLDRDGIPECVLASDRVFALFDLLGGRLELLFVKDASGVHQVIAPSYQFITGLADPGSWNEPEGEAADPAVIPGAFADHTPPWKRYLPRLDSGRLTLVSPGGEIVKTFSLSESGVQVQYHSESPLDLLVPLGIDPWERFEPGWGFQYNGEGIPAGWRWGIAGGPQVEIRTSSRLDFLPFTDSRTVMKEAENPNFDYPAGHYLPFPMAVAKILGDKDFEITIDLISPR